MSPFFQLFTRFRISAYVLSLTVTAAIAGPVPTNKPSDYPDWWFTQDVIPRLNPNNATPDYSIPGTYPPADDYAVTNIGQLKHIAITAAAELNAILPSGAGADINNLVSSWNPNSPNPASDDFAALNQGQLKYIGSLFYKKLAAYIFAGQPLLPSQRFPWTVSTSDDDAYALVNIGQMKHVFRFSVVGLSLDAYKADTDMDGIPNGWEMEHGLNPFDFADASAVVGGLTNLELYQQSLAAGGDPMLANAVGLLIYTPY